MKLSTAALSLAIGFAAIATAAPASAQGVTFLKGQEPSQILAYRLGGTNVFNRTGEKVGTIADVALDANGQAQSVVLSVGGFLGVGRKYVGVPFSAVRIGPAVEAGRVIFVDVTKDQLKAAPSYKMTDPSRTDRAKKTATKWLNAAKDKAMELGNQAKDAVQDMREKMAKPAEGAKN